MPAIFVGGLIGTRVVLREKMKDLLPGYGVRQKLSDGGGGVVVRDGLVSPLLLVVESGTGGSNACRGLFRIGYGRSGKQRRR